MPPIQLATPIVQTENYATATNLNVTVVSDAAPAVWTLTWSGCTAQGVANGSSGQVTLTPSDEAVFAATLQSTSNMRKAMNAALQSNQAQLAGAVT